MANNKIKKLPHNKWIEGLDKGKRFFETTQMIGYFLIYILMILTMISFWLFVYVANIEGLKDVAILILNTLRLGITLFVFSLSFKLICDFLYTYFYSKELKKIKEEGIKKYVNSR